LENGFAPAEKKEKKTISKVEEEKELSAGESKAKIDALTARVAELELELANKDARLKELGGQ